MWSRKSYHAGLQREETKREKKNIESSRLVGETQPHINLLLLPLSLAGFLQLKGTSHDFIFQILLVSFAVFYSLN